MSESVKGKERTGNFRRGFQRGSSRPIVKSFQNHKSKITELEDATFNCGHRDNAARYESAVEDISSYVIRTYKGGIHVGTAIRNGALPDLLNGFGVRRPKMIEKAVPSSDTEDTKPVILGEDEYDNKDLFEIAEMCWKEAAKTVVMDIKLLQDGNMKLYSLLLEQCSPEMKNRVRGTKGFGEVDSAQHGVNLLAIIREIMCGVEEHLQHTWGMVQVDKLLYTAFQRPQESNDEWIKRFDQLVTVLEQYGGCTPTHPILLSAMLRKTAY